MSTLMEDDIKHSAASHRSSTVPNGSPTSTSDWLRNPRGLQLACPFGAAFLCAYLPEWRAQALEAQLSPFLMWRWNPHAP